MSSAAAPRAQSVSVDQASGAVRLLWCDGVAKTFHPLWLRDNCVATRHAASGQKLVSAARLPAQLRAAVAEIQADGDVLRVTWEPDAHESAYSASWLRSFGDAVPVEPPPTVPPALPRFSFAALEAGDAALRWEWISALREHGAVLVHGAPCEPDTVSKT